MLLYSKQMNRLLILFAILTIGCSKDDVVTDVTPITITNPDGTVEVVTDGMPGILSGAYGLQGEFTTSDSGIQITKYAGTTAPGPVWYLSNQSRSIAGGIRLGDAQKTAGAHTILTGEVANFTYLILWCEPFSQFIGFGQLGKG